jgi:hypothetical protein
MRILVWVRELDEWEVEEAVEVVVESFIFRD